MRILPIALALVLTAAHGFVASAQDPQTPSMGYSVAENGTPDVAPQMPANQTGQAAAAPPAAPAAPQGEYIAPQGSYVPQGGYVAPAPPPSGGYYVPAWVYVPGNYEPCWDFRFDIVALQRSTTRSQPLFVDAQQQALLDSQTDLDFPMQAGLELELARKFSGGWELQFGLFSIDGWVADNEVPGPSFLVVGGDTMMAHDGVARYRSSLALFEINLRRQWTENIAFLAGFRCGSLDERYTAWTGHHGYDHSFVSDTNNALFGFQIGTDVKLLTCGSLTIGGMCKAGIYGNAVDQRSWLANDYVGVRLDGESGHTAFLGEVGLSATYQFTPRFAAKAYYQVSWLEGVALAPEQIAGSDFTGGTLSINADSGLFYHGGGIGLEWKF